MHIIIKFSLDVTTETNFLSNDPSTCIHKILIYRRYVFVLFFFQYPTNIASKHNMNFGE